MVGHKGWCTGTGTAEWAYMGWYLCSPNAPSRPDYDMASGPFCAPLAGRAERAGCTLVTAAHKHTSELVNSSISLSVCISFASIAAAHASSSHCRASVLFIAGAGEVQPCRLLAHRAHGIAAPLVGIHAIPPREQPAIEFCAVARNNGTATDIPMGRRPA